MRTTIEIPDEQRARLLELAADRGEKGFSRLVQEALDLYLKGEQARRDRIESARSALGTLDDAEADELRGLVREIRARWR